jgi:DNA-binding HxlR family transcriptional regulator
VRARRSQGLLALARWAGRGSAGDSAVHHVGNPAVRYGELDWQKALEQLSPVRPRWDLAIVSNLDPETGRRPKDILAAVNAQVETEHTLSPQVLSARLRYLEQDGYVRHEDSSAAPLRRVYYLLPRGTLLIDNLLAIVGSLAAGRASKADAGARSHACSFRGQIIV